MFLGWLGFEVAGNEGVQLDEQAKLQHSAKSQNVFSKVLLRVKRLFNVTSSLVQVVNSFMISFFLSSIPLAITIMHVLAEDHPNSQGSSISLNAPWAWKGQQPDSPPASC